MNFSCVYRLQCLDKEVKEFYIGSTKNYRKRRNQHKCEFNRDNKYNVYKFIRENGGWENWEMIELHNTDKITEIQRIELEQIYMNLLKPELNSQEAYVGRKAVAKKNNSKRANCPICNKEMLSRGIKRHICRKHKT